MSNWFIRKYRVVPNDRSYVDERYFWTLRGALDWWQRAGTGAHIYYRNSNEWELIR